MLRCIRHDATSCECFWMLFGAVLWCPSATCGHAALLCCPGMLCSLSGSFLACRLQSPDTLPPHPHAHTAIHHHAETDTRALADRPDTCLCICHTCPHVALWPTASLAALETPQRAQGGLLAVAHAWTAQGSGATC